MAENEPEAVVKVGRTSVVKPAIQTPTQTMFLSNLDFSWLPFNNVQRLFFYTQSPLNDYSSLIQGMRESLSSILVYFYPLAGRLKKGESGRMEVDCNDEGVEFMEASINIPFQDLEKDGFRRKPFFPKLVQEVNLSEDENYSRPLLLIQITEFEGGGICIGTTLHHVIADGNSFWHFMTSWAECSRGLPLAKPPQHSRTVFKRDDKSPLSISYKVHEIISQGITGAKIFKFVPDNPQSDHIEICGSDNVERPNEVLQKWVDPKRKTEVIYSTFCFTEEIIQDLKQRSGASTSFVAVAAQFWRCVMRAREVPQEEAVYFLFGADCSGRVKPPLLPTYFGNCLSLGLVQTTAYTLINTHISFAADIIQQAITSCTSEEQINYLIDWAESTDRNFIALVRDAGWKYGTNAVSSPRFPLYETDYGWGKPLDVQTATMIEIGVMFMSCAKDGGKSIFVSTCLPQHQMDVLHHLLSVSEE
ncbi:hydroxycinnamoyltransferase [Cryptomeria japonica]|uniref:hydroxycinnamoyltransferase n=1 Tax=Cryptomeria japonica TaxID=3369 RepID=UPI0027DA0C9C|nr:hydroxycinnamoyltransferase [Cryptomeria japonica]